MDKPPQLFVAGISKLGSMLYLHWESLREKTTCRQLDDYTAAAAYLCVGGDSLMGFLHLETVNFILWYIIAKP